jgi:secondary thiamine-phosphate synthase enzyme
MTVKTAELYFEKPVEDLYIINITPDVQKTIHESKVKNGIATVFVGCSTASISTMNHSIENVKEIREILERFSPSNNEYQHHTTSADMYGVGGDHNGKSHIRAAILGPSVTIPLKDGKLMLESGQDVVLMDFDIIKRKRKVIVQIMGE